MSCEPTPPSPPSRPLVSNRAWGSRCEARVAEELSRRGYTHVTSNLRLYFAEIDLLLVSPQGELVVVEVKAVNEDAIWFQLIKPEQRKRLRRVFDHLLASSPRPVRMHFAAVNQRGQVTLIEDFLAQG